MIIDYIFNKAKNLSAPKSWNLCILAFRGRCLLWVIKNMGRYISKEDSTALKGIAILWMIFHHCFHDIDLFKDLNLNFAPFTMEGVLNVGIYAKVCVAIFAFVSGYGLYLSFMNKSET